MGERSFEVKTHLKESVHSYGIHFSHFVKQMSAFVINEETLARYEDRINGAYQLAKQTNMAQVVDGEGDFLLVITPNAKASWCLKHKVFDLFTEEELNLEYMKEQMGKGAVSEEKYREALKSHSIKVKAAEEAKHITTGVVQNG